MAEPTIKVSIFGKELSTSKPKGALLHAALFLAYVYVTLLSCFSASLVAEFLTQKFPVIDSPLLLVACILFVLGFLREIRGSRHGLTLHFRNHPIAVNGELALTFFALWQLSSTWSSWVLIPVYLPLLLVLMLSMSLRTVHHR